MKISVVLIAILMLVSMIIPSVAIADGPPEPPSGQLIGTYTISYRLNAAGCPPWSGQNGNPFYCISPIPPGPYFIDPALTPYGRYAVRTIACNGGANANVWYGDASGGSRFYISGQVGHITEFEHTFGQIVLYAWDWYVWDNDVNNTMTVELWRLPLDVEIDIKPGSDPNCFNNNGHGVIPVAILGNDAFDVTQIDASTITLEGLAIKTVGKGNKLLAHISDVNADGFDDLVVQIEDVDGTFASGNGTATVTGTLLDGTPIEGTDSICVVP